MIIAIDPFSLLQVGATLLQTLLFTGVTLPTTAASSVNLISRLLQKISGIFQTYNEYESFAYPYQTLENIRTINTVNGTNNNGIKPRDSIITQNGKVVPRQNNQLNNDEELTRLIIQFLSQFPQYKNYQIVDETQPQNANLYSHPYILIPVNLEHSSF